MTPIRRPDPTPIHTLKMRRFCLDDRDRLKVHQSWECGAIQLWIGEKLAIRVSARWCAGCSPGRHLKAAKSQGIDGPHSLLARADEIIDRNRLLQKPIAAVHESGNGPSR
jgi:hypothetical protein